MTMKKHIPLSAVFITFVILSVLSHPCRAETEVSGTISNDTTWTIDSSPYIVTGEDRKSVV